MEVYRGVSFIKRSDCLPDCEVTRSRDMLWCSQFLDYLDNQNEENDQPREDKEVDRVVENFLKIE